MGQTDDYGSNGNGNGNGYGNGNGNGSYVNLALRQMIAEYRSKRRTQQQEQGPHEPTRIKGYRITLTVRGKTLVKEYSDEALYNRWRATYESHRRMGQSGIERVSGETLYE